MVHAANDRGNLLMDDPKDADAKDKNSGGDGPMNVILLKNEVDLE